MNKVTTSDRLKQIMQERSLKQVDILELCKPFCEKYGIALKKNNLSQYISGVNTPGQDRLSILGMALNVSEVWLMGFDVPMKREAPISFSAQEHPLMKIYDSLNGEGQDNLMRYATDLSEMDKYKKCPDIEQDIV